MPLYHYECTHCARKSEQWSTIAQMLEAERLGIFCTHCNEPLRRDYAPQRHVTFHEGLYENIADDPIYITSAQQLTNECRERGNSSVYMKDMGGLFGAKENRWI